MIKIAVDGPAGSGKGTISKYLATYFNLKYVDTGLFYRSLGLLVQKSDIKFDDESSIEKIAQTVDESFFNNPLLRTEEIAGIASKLAIIPMVREILTAKMRYIASNFEKKFNGCILDGRDVGTVIMPDADIKFYITADEEIRFKRRHQESKNIFFEKVDFESIKNRDKRDSTRKSNPLTIAIDALVVDTTNMNIDQSQQYCKNFILKHQYYQNKIA
jgi:cytidylate kinase